MPVTIETTPRKKTKNDKYNATPRSLEITMRLDLSGGGAISVQRLAGVVNEIVDATRAAADSQKLDLAGLSGEWAWVYGPWYKGAIS